jgi:hypothetical protein
VITKLTMRMSPLQDKLKDKLPPPALNRPTTQQRVPDPGRFRSIDMQPENAQQDPVYQRMVQDVSKTLQTSKQEHNMHLQMAWHVICCLSWLWLHLLCKLATTQLES